MLELQEQYDEYYLRNENEYFNFCFVKQAIENDICDNNYINILFYQVFLCQRIIDDCIAFLKNQIISILL